MLNEDLELKKDKKDEIKENTDTTKVIKTENVDLKEKIKNIFSKKYILIIAVILIVIVCLVIVKCLFFNKVINYPIAFVENEQLILYDGDTNKKIIVEEEFKEEDNSYLTAIYSQSSKNYFAYVNGDTLYLYNIKKDSKEKITSGMEDGSLYFSENGKYLIYQDDDESIYSYDIKGKEKKKIIDGEFEAEIEIAGNYLYMVCEDAIYLKDLNSDKDKEKIVSEEIDSARVQINEDGTKMLYELVDDEELETLSVYVYNVQSSGATKALTGVVSYDYNDDFSEFIYSVKSKEHLGFLEDDELDNDPVVVETRKCTYSDYKNGLCTRNQWLDNEEIQVEVSKKVVNDKIRDYIENDMPLYDVYYKEISGDSNLLVKSVNSVVGYNVKNKMIMYTRYSTGDKVKISTLDSLDALKDFIDDVLKEYIYYSENGNKETEISNTDDLKINGVHILDNKDIYIVSYDSKKELYYYNKNDNKLVLLDENYYVVYKKEEDNIIYVSDYSDSVFNLKQAKGSTVAEIIDKVSWMLPAALDSALVLNECENKYSCNLHKMDGNKVKEITDNVDYAYYINDNYMYLVKNYSDNRNTADIYSYKKGKIQNIALDVNLDYIAITSYD